MVPFRLGGELVEFVDQAQQQRLVFARWRDGSEHVIFVFTRMGSKARHVPFKSNEQVEFVGPPKAVPWVIPLPFLTPGFEGKREACSIQPSCLLIAKAAGLLIRGLCHRYPLSDLTTTIENLDPLWIFCMG